MRRLGRWALGLLTGWLALACTGAVLGFWLPGWTTAAWLATTLTTEQSLLLLLPAAGVVGGALLVRRWGGRRSGALLAAVGLAVAALSPVPAVLGARTAAAEGVRPDWGAYVDGTALRAERGPDSTEVVAEVAGRVLRADVWRPAGDAPAAGWPTVVWVHGGSWRAGSRADTPRWPEWLADEGYLVVSVDYRLAPPPTWAAAPADVACALGWVAGQAGRLGADPARLAVKGVSAGAHLALLSAYADEAEEFDPSCPVERVVPAAVLALYPPTDLAALAGLDGWRYPDLAPTGPGTLRILLGDSPQGAPERYRLASPLHHVDADVPPTLLVSGDRDQVVPVDQSRRLAAALAAAGVRHRLVELPLANHAYDLAWGGVNAQTTRAVLARFLATHLGEPPGQVPVRPPAASAGRGAATPRASPSTGSA